MEKVTETQGAPVPCSVCGGTVDGSGACTRCGTRVLTDVPPPPSGRLERGEAIRLYAGMEGVGEGQATILYDRGYTSLESLRDASAKELLEIPGFTEPLAETVRTSAAALLGSTGKGNDALRRWLSGDNGNGLSQWLGDESTNGETAVKAKSDQSTEALRKWLSGEESAFDEWLGKEGPSNLPMAFEVQALEPVTQLEAASRERQEAMDRAQGDLQVVRAELERYLERAKTGDLDPVKIIEEAALSKQSLDAAQRRIQELQEEIQHVKKGSIAVIKYVKAQQVKAGSSELRKQLTEEANQRKRLEIQLKHTQELVAQIQGRIESGVAPDQQAVFLKEAEIAKKEAELNAKMEELKTLEEAASKGEIDIGGTGASVELQQRLQEELRQREEEYQKREGEIRKRASDLEGEIAKLQIELKLRDEAADLSGKSSTEVASILQNKETALQVKEKSILIREQEIERLKEDLAFKEEEFKKLKEPLQYKEEEMTRREQEVEYQLKRIESEKRKVEEAKALGASTEEVEMKQRLEQLKGEINQKEEEVRAKEKYLKSKMEELRLREQGLVEEEIEAREEDRSAELKKEKCKTGIPRLDDLLLGGIPFGSNITIYGPAFVGKEVVIDLFAAEALRKGVPVIWVLTEKGPMDIREEITPVLPSYEQYEKMGLVRYVDAYSRSMGSEETEANTVYIAEPTDWEGILKAVDETTKELRKKHNSYRLAFRSVSTLIAYLDTTAAFKFLQPFTGRRKRERAVSLYVLEKGMHEEQDIQMLGSLMDGMLDFKLEQLKTYIAVKGVGDVQSRAWIEYAHSKSNVSIRSFSLGHIK